MEADVRRAVGALKMAIRVEQSGYRFYRRAAEETKEPKGKELFNSLALDEEAHESILRGRLGDGSPIGVRTSRRALLSGGTLA